MFATPPLWGVVFFYTNLMPILMLAIFIVWLIGAVLSGRMAYVFTEETDLARRSRKIFIAATLSWIVVVVSLLKFYINTKRYE